MKNNILKLSLPVIFFLIYTLPLMAQTIDPPDTSDDPEYQETPIDNWQILLLLAGIVVGLYFMRKYRLAGKSN